MIHPLYTYHTIDKSTWGDGPWQQECDKMQWRDEATGLPCLAVRNPGGAWCGYVGVTEGHALFGKDHHVSNIDVHDNLSFADKCQPEDGPGNGICHIPELGQPDHVWWFGFSCAGPWDQRPAAEARYRTYGVPLDDDVTYRDLPYVQEQVTNLARQLAALAGNTPVATVTA